MKNILIDTCSWIDLLSENSNKLLPHLEFWKNNNCINIITHEIILQEWNEHKVKQKKKFFESINTKYKHAVEIGKKEKLLIPENLAPNIQNIENQIRTIDELLKSATVLKTSDDIKIICSDRTILKQAPFHNKVDSMKDAYIIFSALTHFSNQNHDFIFISANKDDFGSPSNLELAIHPDIIDNYSNVNMVYFSDIGRVINNLKQEIPLVLLPEDTNNLNTIELKDEIVIDKTKPILDQIHDYVSIRHNELNFYPIDIFIDHYPFKLESNSYSYYAIFNLTINNEELFGLFKAVEISEKNHVSLTNPIYYEGVNNYEEKITKVLKNLTNNLIFNISNEKSRERITIRFSENNNCKCPKCSFRKFNFSECFRDLNSYDNSREDLLKSSYVNYLIGNYKTAAEKQQNAYKLFKKDKKNISSFICQFNLLKLAVFIRNNYFGENAQDKLVEKLKEINLEYEATNLSSRENKKIIKYLRENTFYTNSRDKIQTSSTKLIDQYYSSLNGGWSSNSEVWALINEFAKLETFLNGNYIIYDQFKEFNDIFTLFTEGLFASHGIDDSHHSRLEKFDDWLIIKLLNYGNADLINKYYKRYKHKKISYKTTSSNEDSFTDLIDNFFNNNNLRESYTENCEKGNRKFWDYYNSIFKNILTLVSICDFDEVYYNSFTHKLINYLEEETYIHHQNYKFINTYLYRCGKHINKELLSRVFDLGLNKSIYHNSDFYDALLKVTEIKKIKFDITKTQFSKIKNLAFEDCTVCKDKHPISFIIPLYLMIDNFEYKKEIGDIINTKLQEGFNFDLFYQSTLFELIPFNKEMFDQARKLSLPKNRQPSLKSIFSDKDDNRFDMVDSLLNLCYKFNINTTTDEFESFKSLDKYYEWLFDMDSFDYDQFKPEWLAEYSTRFYFKKFHSNKFLKDKLDEIIKEKFETSLDGDYLNIYVRKTWDIEAK